MNGKGAIVKMLQRRWVSASHAASVGDSMGDVGMFEESDCSILFNPWDDRPRAHARHIIEEKDLGWCLTSFVNDLDCQTLMGSPINNSMVVDDLMSICPHCGFLLVCSSLVCRARCAARRCCDRGVTLLDVLGKDHLTNVGCPASQLTTRSTPKPKPPCGTPP